MPLLGGGRDQLLEFARHLLRDTGDVVAGTELDAQCRKILADADVAYVHIRSKFNCFQCRVDRAAP